MADSQGFLTHRERELPPRRPVPLRLMDWKEVYQDAPVGQLPRQASRCMDCGIPFCHSGCPLGNLIPEWNTLAWQQQWERGIDRLHATNNFPEFTGRLCPAPCETACVLGISQPAVTIKQVEVTLVEKAWEEGFIETNIPDRLTGKTVAVVGSGPAGLATAQQLTRAGHTVAVYERDEAPGGLLRFGIPEFKMEKSVVDRRIQQMEAEGVRFRTGIEIGRDMTAEQLQDRFDAVVIATGSTVRRDLLVPGREHTGTYQAMDYLPQANRSALGIDVPEQITAANKNVIIIGGGDTGADCLGTALRQGATSVTSLEIMPQPTEERPAHQPWPLYPNIFRVASAHEEGGERRYSVSTKEILANKKGQVSGLKVVEVEFVDGTFVEIAGTETVLPADMIFLAMGFTGVETAGFIDQLDVQVDQRGQVVRDDNFMAAPGVFVAGDAGRGQSLIVWAIAEGRSVAAAVDRYLMGASSLPTPIKSTDRPASL